MTPASRFAARQAALCRALGHGTFAFAAGRDRPRNYPANVLEFRADSTFLWLFGLPAERGAVALLDAAAGRATLFLDPGAADDALWHGEAPSLAERGAPSGVADLRPLSQLERAVAAARPVRALPHTDPATVAELRALGVGVAEFGAPLDDAAAHLADALIGLRMCKDADELAELRAACALTARGHRAAMRATRPGRKESDVRAALEAEWIAADVAPAYPSIVTVRGEVLHNRTYGGTLAEGDLLLCDAGAESPGLGYASDVTRTWPVSGRFSERQRDAYALVLASQRAAIAKCRVGVEYREVHLEASRVLAEGLVALGLLRGDPAALVADGAHAVFFPHGIGHLLGLDVHDMEGFGDRAGYAPGRARSSQFGLSYLRLDRPLVADCVVTIEPGFYVVPAILRDLGLHERLGDRVAWAEAERWIGFGGIRIEDDVRVTGGDPEVLTSEIPKNIEAVESSIGA